MGKVEDDGFAIGWAEHIDIALAMGEVGNDDITFLVGPQSPIAKISSGSGESEPSFQTEVGLWFHLECFQIELFLVQQKVDGDGRSSLCGIERTKANGEQQKEQGQAYHEDAPWIVVVSIHVVSLINEKQEDENEDGGDADRELVPNKSVFFHGAKGNNKMVLV